MMNEIEMEELLLEVLTQSPIKEGSFLEVLEILDIPVQTHAELFLIKTMVNS